MKKNINILLLSMIISATSVYAGTNYSYNSNTQVPQYQQSYYSHSYGSPSTTLKGRVVTVPSGETLPVVSTCAISSENAYQGQTFTLALASDFYYNGSLIAPAGSSIVGNVIEVNKAKRGSMNGKLCVRFNQIVTPNGLQIPISAVIKTDDGSGVLVGGTKLDVAKNYGKNAVIGSAAGAVSGVVFGALAGSNVGRGAALGTAVGAGGSLVKSVWDKGNNVSIPAGASFDIVLTQPITVTPCASDYE